MGWRGGGLDEGGALAAATCSRLLCPGHECLQKAHNAEQTYGFQAYAPAALTCAADTSLSPRYRTFPSSTSFCSTAGSTRQAVDALKRACLPGPCSKGGLHRGRRSAPTFPTPSTGASAGRQRRQARCHAKPAVGADRSPCAAWSSLCHQPSLLRTFKHGLPPPRRTFSSPIVSSSGTFGSTGPLIVKMSMQSMPRRLREPSTQARALAGEPSMTRAPSAGGGGGGGGGRGSESEVMRSRWGAQPGRAAPGRAGMPRML